MVSVPQANLIRLKSEVGSRKSEVRSRKTLLGFRTTKGLSNLFFQEPITDYSAPDFSDVVEMR